MGIKFNVKMTAETEHDPEISKSLKSRLMNGYTAIGKELKGKWIVYQDAIGQLESALLSDRFRNSFGICEVSRHTIKDLRKKDIAHRAVQHAKISSNARKIAKWSMRHHGL